MRSLAMAALAGLLVCSTSEARLRPPTPTQKARKPATIAVAIEGMRFSPADLAVKAGDTIVWTNGDIVAHTVTAKTGAFDSKIIPPDGTWKYVARSKGDFVYFCSLHQPMTAALKVR